MPNPRFRPATIFQRLTTVTEWGRGLGRPLATSMIVPLCALLTALSARNSCALEAITDKIVVLTFDDSVKSHYTVVRPILKKHGFGATFFITEGFEFKTNKDHYMTWEQIAQLHQDGFEIGNHTRDHNGIPADDPALLSQRLADLPQQLSAINDRCREYGIPRPTSFAYPGNSFHTDALPILRDAGIRFARRGGSPEFERGDGRGFAFEPSADHPLLVPSAGIAKPDWTIDDLKRAVSQATLGRIAVLQFHGVPDEAHPWVHTPADKFEEYMAYLAKHRYRVIALRDLKDFVDPAETPTAPLAVIQERRHAVESDQLQPYFQTLATEGKAPAGFPNTAAAKLAAVSGLMKVIDAELPVPPSIELRKGIEYGTGGGRPLQLDLYTPKEQNGLTPGLLFIHGGAWRKGKRSDYHYYGVKLAEAGYVVATASYRLLPEHAFPAAVHDTKCAVRWMRANAAEIGIDADCIAVIGGSAGGHLSMMIGYSSDVPELEGDGGHAGVSSRVKALVNLYGPTDLTTHFGRQSPLVQEFLGNQTYESAPDAYRMASPITHLTPDDPPTLIIHGTIDDTVPVVQADYLAERLQQLQIPFRYDRIDGWPHTLDISQTMNARVRELMLEFFDQHLRKSDSSP